MSILENAVRKTEIYGNKNEIQQSFHIALTGTANYIPYKGLTLMSICQSNP